MLDRIRCHGEQLCHTCSADVRIQELLTSPMLKYRSYRSRDLKLRHVILTLECACVEWYGTCITFARYTLGGIVCTVISEVARGLMVRT